MERRRLSPSALALAAIALLVIIVVAFLAGVLSERLRWDAERSDMLRRYDRALKEHQKQIMDSEKQPERGGR